MNPPGRPPRPPQDGANTVTIATKVRYLGSLLGPGDEAIETHFAWVFLVGERAWKLRKPVRRDTMDYGTLAARRHDSEEEVRLNRRLATHVYLGTRPLTRAASGRFAIGGDGEIVDWLVEMRRLDRSRMLDVQLTRGAASHRALQPVIALLADFYLREDPALTHGPDLDARLRRQVMANNDVLDGFERDAAAATCGAQVAFLDRHRALVEARATQGCVVEAHGDLRPEHILLDTPPAVIDCLEFDRNLRILDRAEELSFLELECARLGHGTTGRWLLRECLQRLDDAAPERLLRFYRSHRAATRAKLYVWRAGEPDGGSPKVWYSTARDYLAAAREDAMRAAS